MPQASSGAAFHGVKQGSFAQGSPLSAALTKRVGRPANGRATAKGQGRMKAPNSRHPPAPGSSVVRVAARFKGTPSMAVAEAEPSAWERVD